MRSHTITGVRGSPVFSYVHELYGGIMGSKGLHSHGTHIRRVFYKDTLPPKKKKKNKKNGTVIRTEIARYFLAHFFGGI